jgi:hypothetical protein
VAERPILFSGPMVRAILDGRKTQTRRVVKPPPSFACDSFHFDAAAGCWFPWVETTERIPGASIRCPYGAPGDVLWVRETWCYESHPTTSKLTGRVFYRASDDVEFADDGDGGAIVNKDGTFRSPWKSPLHMPRAASRLSLLVKRVRVERLQAICIDDAMAEGARACRIPADEHGPERIGYCFGDDDGESILATTSICAFLGGWDTINGKRAPWASNPWVWVVEFERRG